MHSEVEVGGCLYTSSSEQDQQAEMREKDPFSFVHGMKHDIGGIIFFGELK